MSKCTLLVDGNWLLLSRAFAIGDVFNKVNDEETKRLGQINLEDTLARSLTIVLNRFNNVIDNVILVTDGGSWRKKLSIPHSLTDTGVKYKGTRETIYQEKDFDCIFSAFNNFADRCKDAGMTVSRGTNIEGDDWIWYWSRKLNENGINCIIWSSDNDLKQLVQFNETSFTAWYNDKKGLFLHESAQDKPIDELDFFMTSQDSNPILDRLRSQAKSVEYINPDIIIEEKIIMGDMSDNIKSIIRGNKGERKVNISNNDWKRVEEGLNIKSLTEFFDNTDNIINKLFESKRLRNLGVTFNEAKELFEYNKKLVWLHSSQIPEKLQHEMDKSQYKLFDVNYIKNNYKVLANKENETENIESIFNGIL